MSEAFEIKRIAEQNAAKLKQETTSYVIEQKRQLFVEIS